jgi:hypothetical protein
MGQDIRLPLRRKVQSTQFSCELFQHQFSDYYSPAQLLEPEGRLV